MVAEASTGYKYQPWLEKREPPFEVINRGRGGKIAIRGKKTLPPKGSKAKTLETLVVPRLQTFTPATLSSNADSS